MSESKFQEVTSRLEAGLDGEMFEKGYELTSDPDTTVTFGGMNYPQGDWRGVHVSVGLHSQETVEWFRDRDMLDYISVFGGDSQIVTDSSFVLGSLIAATEVRQAARTATSS